LKGIHFMPGIPNHLAFFPECIKRMPRNEEGGLDAIFIEQLQKAPHAYRAGEKTFCLRETTASDHEILWA